MPTMHVKDVGDFDITEAQEADLRRLYGQDGDGPVIISSTDVAAFHSTVLNLSAAYLVQVKPWMALVDLVGYTDARMAAARNAVQAIEFAIGDHRNACE